MAQCLDNIKCCAPGSMMETCNKETIRKTHLFEMVKMICTFSNCDQSGFMHPSCFAILEENLVRFLKTMPFTNNHKKETFRRFNFDKDHVRQFLWKEKSIYSMIYKNITCNCGKGFLKKDLNWPPATYRRRKKSGTESSLQAHLPKLGTVPSGIVRYRPAYTSDIPATGDQAEKTIPGAQFVDKKVETKRGEVMVWDTQEGQIRNIANEEKRMCMFKESQKYCFSNFLFFILA